MSVARVLTDIGESAACQVALEAVLAQALSRHIGIELVIPLTIKHLTEEHYF